MNNTAKRIIIAIVICILVIASSITVLSVSNVLLKDETNEEQELLAYVDITTKINLTTTSSVTTIETTTTTTTVNNYNYIDGIVEKKGNISDTNISIANNEVNKLPSNLINKFISDGWHIYVTDENIAEVYFGGTYSSVQGATIYESKTIVLANNATYIQNSLIHEIGHYVDFCRGYFLSDTPTFESIYNLEVEYFKSRIVNSSCVRDQQEFFAEEFFYIYKDSSKCTEQAYNYISNVINSL